MHKSLGPKLLCFGLCALGKKNEQKPWAKATMFFLKCIGRKLHKSLGPKLPLIVKSAQILETIIHVQFGVNVLFSFVLFSFVNL